MKLLLGIAAFLFITIIPVFAQAPFQQQVASEQVPTFTDQELRQRLRQMPKGIIPAQFNPAVRSYINTYTVRARTYTEEMLGRSLLYFPLIEKQLQEAGLPADLRFLAIVESGLRPDAVSRAKATGLWQFMYATGKEMGLRITRYVDERRDPHAATIGAMKYLKQLHDRYHDWELALAAYNSGPGTVDRAIRRSRSRDYWRLRGHLPRETRNYVPAFIAAMYLWNHYQLHNLVPIYPDELYHNTAWMKVYTSITFDQITEITSLEKNVVKFLNPSYKKGFIPYSAKGYNLVLPLTEAQIFVDHLNQQTNEMSNTPPYIQAVYLVSPPGIASNIRYQKKRSSRIHNVRSGENLYQIARRYGCSVQQIKSWNYLRSDYIYPGQQLSLFSKIRRVRIPFSLDRIPMVPIELLAMNSISEDLEAPQKNAILPAKLPKLPKYYKLKTGETLEHVANKYPQLTIQEIKVLNDFEVAPKRGEKVRLRK